MRILIIEDDTDFSCSLHSQLVEHGFEADVCQNGSDGLFYMKQETYHLILLDRMLPVLDGMHFLQIIRQQGIMTPVIFITGLGNLSEKITGLNCGADDYLVKPFAFEELLARIYCRAISIHKESTFINNLLIESYEKFENLAAQKKILIDFHLPDVLIPEVDCDPERISQVFTVLLDNAISYTPQGGTIQVAVSLQTNHVIISVADNGPGIPDESKEKIFHRFYRCDNSRTDKNHFGLGLSIAKEIIDLHNGTIAAVDSPIGGAKFIVTLPLNSKHH